MEKKNINIINLSANKLPIFKETRNLEWIKLGNDDNWALDMYQHQRNSPTHNSIIQTKIDMAYGNGLEAIDNDKKTEKYLKDKKLNKLSYKLLCDLITQGGCYYEVTNSNDGSEIASFKFLPYNKVRLEKMDEFGEINNIYFSNDFKQSKKEDYIPIKITIYNDFKNTNKQVVHLQHYTPGLDYYQYTTYMSALNWIEIDYRISNFHLNGLSNGFFPSVAIHLIDNTSTEEELQFLHRKMNKELSSDNNSGKIILTTGVNKDDAPVITPIPTNDNDKLFDQLHNDTLQNIMTAHQLTSPMLAGIKTEGQLGGRSELIDANEMFYRRVIKKEQKMITDSLNDLLKRGGYEEVNFINNNIIDFNFSENILIQILDKDELREMIGKEALTSKEEEAGKINVENTTIEDVEENNNEENDN